MKTKATVTRLRVLLASLILWVGQSPSASEASTPQSISPRVTVREFLTRVAAGQGREAFALTSPNSTAGWGMHFPELIKRQRIRPLHQSGTEQHAMVISNPFRWQASTQVFYAFLVRDGTEWRISRTGRVSAKEADWMLQGYHGSPEVAVDATAEELVGSWWAPCDSTITFSENGTGTQLLVGPGGPEEGVAPESFTWNLEGNILVRRFADREEELEITRLYHGSVRFVRAKGSGGGGWTRRDDFAG